MDDGVFFASYKYGQKLIKDKDREIWLMDEKSIKYYLNGIFNIIDLWTDDDLRNPINKPRWLYFIARKES